MPRLGGRAWGSGRDFCFGLARRLCRISRVDGGFVTLWAIRKALINRASLAPALVGLMAVISFAVVIMLILYWKRAHNLVLGGGAEEASTDGRWEQWREAWPLIKSNPSPGTVS